VDLLLTGTPVHTRALTLLVSELGAGRVRALGSVIDLRKSGFNPMFGDVQPAGLIHDMEIDAEVDLASGTLEKLATAQRRVAVEPAPVTRGESCRDPAARLQALVGRRFDADFLRELTAVQGGPRGCSHLLILFQLIADSLPGALARERELRAGGARRRERESIFRRSLLFDGMLREADHLQLAVQLSDWHNGPDDGIHPPAERLVHVHEVRVQAELELATAKLRAVRAAERERHETWPRKPWVDRSDVTRALVGQPILPGLGGFVLRRFGSNPADRMLAHALLHLAPGFVQCTALFSDRPAGSAGTAPAGGSRAALPSIPIGGYTDSCYMWRSEGPLIQLRNERLRR
jgi:hypothetical protein